MSGLLLIGEAYCGCLLALATLLAAAAWAKRTLTQRARRALRARRSGQ